MQIFPNKFADVSRPNHGRRCIESVSLREFVSSQLSVHGMGQTAELNPQAPSPYDLGTRLRVEISYNSYTM